MELALWEWPGEGPPILFCHATGFHARVWDQVIGRLPGRRCLAFDTRGHGASSKPEPPYSWRFLGADLAALVQQIGLEGAIGVGHSCGGHSLTLAAAQEPGAFSALLLLDAAIWPREQYVGLWTAGSFAAKRRNEWGSPGEMFDRFIGRAPFDRWDRDVLRDYCEHGLRAEGGRYVLACPPAIEASVYEHSLTVESDIYDEIAMVKAPVHVVRAGLKQDPANFMAQSPTPPDLASKFVLGRDTCLADHSHFIPMEAPELTAKLVAGELGLL